MRSVLIIGGNGFLGKKMQELAPAKTRVYIADVAPSGGGSKREFIVDVSDTAKLLGVVRSIHPDSIIYLAKSPMWNNAPDILIEPFRQLISDPDVRKARFIFLSTDAVFDGTSSMYGESDMPNPTTGYGVWKMQLETILKKEFPQAIIVRTSYLYGKVLGEWDKRTRDVISSVIAKREISRFSDIFRSVTLVDDVAHAVWRLVTSDFSGIIHIAGPRMALVNFYREIVQVTGNDPSYITEQSFREIDPDMPQDTSLDTSLAQGIFGFVPSHPKDWIE